MTERPRPYIPLSVRVQVAKRQADLKEYQGPLNGLPGPGAFSFKNDRQLLAALLRWLFGDEPVHLDHDPALRLREFNPRTGKYKPDANDPNHLLYRTTHDHHIKTNVRGDGAQYSDTVLMKRERKRQKKKSGRKRKWRWPKGRKIPKRVKPWGR